MTYSQLISATKEGDVNEALFNPAGTRSRRR